MRLSLRVLPVALVALVTSAASAGCSLMIDIQDYGDSVCGNGVIEGDEECDTDDLGDVTCASMGLGGGELICDGDCVLDTGDCEAQPECGDGVRNGTEECEGEDFGDATCASMGLGGGDLICADGCLIATDNCDSVPVCGDGTINTGSEQCDGADLGGQTCGGLGQGEGALTCNMDCTYDIDACAGPAECDNGVLETGEVCDTAEFGGVTCQTLGFYYGNLSCINNCEEIDTSDCNGTCGDLIINGPEVCDGVNTVGTTCMTMSFPGGMLGCNPNCGNHVTTQCFQNCGNSIVDQGEHCDQGNLGGMACSGLGYTNGGALACLQSCYYDVSNCSNPVQCSPGAGSLQCGSVVTGDTSSGFSSDALDRYHGIGCLPFDMTGSEIIYYFNPGTNAQLVHARILNMPVPLDLIVTQATTSGVCFAGNQCLGWSWTGSGEESVVFMAQPNTEYFIIIDGISSTVGSFELELNCL